MVEKFKVVIPSKNKNVDSDVGYKSWKEAQKASRRFYTKDSVNIISRAAKRVFDGEAKYERDSVIFDKIHYSWPLLASLLFAAANCKKLRVIDFGGSFGSTFQQNRRFLTQLSIKCEWRIVEQKEFVEVGKKDFTNSYLSFYDTIKDATKDGVDAVLFGGSICYVPNPYDYLKEAILTNSPYILFDRTTVTTAEHDRFFVQHVPPTIFEASFPMRNFNKSNLHEPFKEKYTLVEEWICDLQNDVHGTDMGFVFKHKSI